MKTKILAGVLIAVGAVTGRNQCSQVRLSHGISCLCNATYCDDFDEIPPVSSDYVIVYTSNENGIRMEQSIEYVTPSASVSGSIKVQLDGSSHQKMIGFGGAFTDSAVYVIDSLSSETQRHMISSYFSRVNGSGYTVGRVPVGSTDFSREQYSLFDADGNFVLKDDNLIDNQDGKVTLIKRAMAEIDATSDVPGDGLQIFSSIWSAPVQWKTCDSPPAPSGTNSCDEPSFEFGGLINDPQVRADYANYLLDFIDAYAAEGIQLWGMTAQNEPGGNPTGNGWENTNYEPADLVSFVENYLGPIVKAKYPDFKIMVFDDNYPEMPDYAELFSESTYIDGLGYHWYYSMAGSLIGTGQLIFSFFGGQVEVSKAYEEYDMDNKNGNGFLLMTEACTGYIDNAIQAGSWERGYNYLTSILHEVDSGAAGWVDWNLALDLAGGPNHADNQVDAAILVDTENDLFYKNPMYYSLAHFSRFVPPGAIRLGITGTDLGFIGSWKALEVVAFRKSATSTDCVLVIANDHLTASLPIRGTSANNVALLKLPYDNKQVVINMPDNTFKTVLFHCPL